MHRIRIVPLVVCAAIGICAPAVGAAKTRAGSPAPVAVLTVMTNKAERTAHRVERKVSRVAHRAGAKVSRVAHRAGAKVSHAAHRAGAKMSHAAHTVERKVKHVAHVVRVKAEAKGAAMKARVHRALHRPGAAKRRSRSA